MANVTKRGNSYRIRVFSGYDNLGKQIVHNMTWKPYANMTKRQIDKELQRQVVLFEEKCLNDVLSNSSIKFIDFSRRWINDYAKKRLKEKTISRYTDLLRRINSELGDMSMDKITPINIIEFYNKLSECGSRYDTKYVATNIEYLNKAILYGFKTKTNFCLNSGISLVTLNKILKCSNLKYETALKISDCLKEDINTLFVKLDKKPLSNLTIQHHHRLLSSIFQTAVNWQIISNNPCQKIKPPSVEQKESSYLDDIEVINLFKFLDGEKLHYKAMIIILVYTGMRRGELLGLKWSDIDFKNKTIRIERELLYLSKKGIFEDTPKNKSSNRVIKVSDEVLKTLISHKKEQNIIRIKNGNNWNNRDFVFTNLYGNPLNPDILTNWFNKFIKKNNLPYANIHSLRHTNASLLIANGINIATVSKRLGHSTTATTTKIYSHAINKIDEIASDTIQNILNIQ